MSKIKKPIVVNPRSQTNVRTTTAYTSIKKNNADGEVGLHFGFLSINYRWLFLGLALNVLGFLLMIGGGTNDPNVFNEQALFSPIRLTVSPMLIIGGYIVMIFAIMKKNKVSKTSDPSID